MLKSQKIKIAEEEAMGCGGVFGEDRLKSGLGYFVGGMTTD